MPGVDIEKLIGQFYRPPTDAADFGRYAPQESIPAPYDELLDHDSHMTVTVERHHGQSVDVVVHRSDRNQNWYCREITLVGSRSECVVQYGIVRLDTTALADEVWQKIESQQTPLGRVLIEHNVLREVQRCGLWKFWAGTNLATLMDCQPGEILYGRTAIIHCNGVPAIELLEIVAKEPLALRP